MKKCPFCDADIEDSARFCLYCMQSLVEKEQILLHKKKKPQWLRIIAAIIALIGISSTMTLMLFDRQTEKSPVTPSKSQLFDPAQSSQPKETGTVPTDPPTVQSTTRPTTQPTPPPTTAPLTQLITEPAAEQTTQPTTEGDIYSYTIKFLDEDGSILSKKTYHWGDMVTQPTAPTKAEDGAYTYTFAGWDKTVVPCQGDATYTATYTRREKGPAFVNSGKCGANLTWTLKEDGTLTISGTGEMADYTYYSRAPWKNHNASIVKVVVQDGVASIGKYAFYDCSGLTGVTIGNSTKSIGEDAFRSCDSLTSITIPGSVTSIGASAFYGCSGLTSITIPDSVTSIEYDTFDSCSKLTSITIPDSVTSIGNFAFHNCSSLMSITIPDSVAHIAPGAFSACSSLSDVFYAGTEAQKNQIVIDSDNEELTSATWHCAESASTDILTFTLNKDGASYSVTDCDQYAEGELAIPSTYKGLPVTGIGSEAFSDCSDLTGITIPDSVTSIGEFAFWNCCNMRSIKIPDRVTRIANSAFSGCESLTSIQLPNGVTDIGRYAFFGCKSLTSIKIPDGVTRIADSAFSGCKSLTSIQIPGGVTVIDINAFRGCSSLTGITIPDGVSSIGEAAFENCSSLTSIVLPKSVTGIGDNAFSGCGNLAYTVYENAKYLGSSGNPYFALIKATNTSIASCTIHNDAKIISGGAFYNCSNLTSITIPGSVVSIGGNAFRQTGIKNIVIPNSVTRIGYAAFFGCVKLTGITLSGRMTTIESSMFVSCSGLKSITIPDGVTRISNDVFAYCSGLTGITIPDSVTRIDEFAFDGCNSLADVFYNGTEAQKNQITIGSNNDALTSAAWSYKVVD